MSPSRACASGTGLSFPRLLLLALLGGPAAVAAAGADPLQEMLAGEFAVQAGDSGTAAAHYLQAALASRDADLAERAARIALHAGDEATTAQALQHWRKLAPASAALHQVEAALALNRNDQAGAVSAFAQLLRSPGEEGWQRALQALAGHPRQADAAQVLAALVAMDALPDQAEAWFAFGGLAARLGDEPLSGQLAAAAVERFPDAPRVWLWQAQRQRLGGNPAQARTAIDRALQLAGEDGRLRLAAAAELDALGDSAAAAQVLARGPQDSDVLLGRVAYLARAEQHDALGLLYDQLSADALAPAPATAPAGQQAAQEQRDHAYFLLGQIAELLERPSEALAWYERIAGFERRGEAMLRQAVALEDLDRWDEARARLRELQANDEVDGESVRNAYLLEAELLIAREQPDAAIGAYGRGLAIFEDDPPLLYARALLLAEQERIEEAEADLARIIAADPHNADALNALGYTLADRTGRLQEARGYIERALELAPESAAIIDSLGWVLFRQGDAAAALVQLRRAFELQPDPEIAAHLGEVLWATGARDEARRVWQQGAELDPANPVLRSTRERLDQ